MKEKINQLIAKGFCIFENILTEELLNNLRKVSDSMLKQTDDITNQGAHVTISYSDPVVLNLITWSASLNALNLLGFQNPRFWSGYVLAKEGGAPPLYFHQDWIFWEDPESVSPTPHQLFLMYYLTDTTAENGCLRLIPESHKRRFDLHDQVGAGHNSAIRTTKDYSNPLFAVHANEIDVPVRAGDLVIGDARLLHSAHSNRTDQRRTVLTLWYLINYRRMSERIRAGFRKNLDFRLRLGSLQLQNLLADYPSLKPLLPDYDGNEEPAITQRKVPSNWGK